jgi:exodeoxyribonuclease V alpha subunit
MTLIQPSLFPAEERRRFIRGRLLYEIFHNPENMYTVSRIRVLEDHEDLGEKELIVVGHYPPLLEGEEYLFWGTKKEHPKYGLQYHLDQFRKMMPQGREAVIQYLSSDLFPGIGKKTAEKIVDTLGDQAIQLILENPDILIEIPQLSAEKRKLIADKLLENQGLEQIMLRLSEFGVGLRLSTLIFQAYRQEALHILEQNPYQLIEDIEGIGFRRADLIAKAMGVAEDAPERIQAGIIFYLWEQSEQHGHVYYPLEKLLPEVSAWLHHESQTVEIGEAFIEEQIMELGRTEKIILDQDRAYLPSLFFAERGFLKKVKQLISTPVAEHISTDAFYRALGELEERLNLEYAATQREAIETALRKRMMILTGGPGTGKTTVIKGICELFAAIHGWSLDPKEYVKKEEPFPILLVAPTGRAAKRMAESTGIPAFTIHRLLGWKGGVEFEHSEHAPVQGKLLVVDECSMMDQWLANQLFRALPDGIQVVLVGDQDQLPSVGPGQILKDLIDSGRIPVVQLQEIYRQAQGSSIITLAHQLKSGIEPTDLEQPQADRRFFSCDSQTALQVIKQVCVSAVRKGYTPKDIQVLAPMYKGEAGIDRINEALQQTLNPPMEQKRELQHGERLFRTGDKILQLVNNPEQHVYNGDIGEVVGIIYAKENTEHEDQLIVQYDQHEVVYTRADLNQITLAYCCSVHKSQGSEFPIVVLPVIRAYARMLRKNLLYTAITRGKDYLILCGEISAFRRAMSQDDVEQRYAYLCTLLQEELPDLATLESENDTEREGERAGQASSNSSDT